MIQKILIVDDEAEIARSLAHLMAREGLAPVVAADGPSALRLIQSESPDVLLLDFRLPGMDGMEVLRQSKKLDEDLPVILLTGFAEVRGAVEAIRAGAHDYLSKPFDHIEVIRVVLRALNERALKQRLKILSSQVARGGNLREILGPSESAGRLIADVERVAKSNFTVLITGETGAGKEVIARAIHELSPRSCGPIVPVDCGAIPETLLESELFGHERGAFTGANQQQQGKFEQAKCGTLFLDEISNMSVGSQAKLLRVLQEKVLYRVGGTKPVETDVRLLAASNHDLEHLSENGSFRRDLFFRLNEFAIRIPPLRERKDDILFLARRFMDVANLELSKQVRGFTKAAADLVLSYAWPGNVRQLRSVIRRAVLLAEESITERHLELNGRLPGVVTDGFDPKYESQNDAGETLPLREIVRRHTAILEREVLERTLRTTGGNKARAARLLQIDYKTIHYKMRGYAIRKDIEETYGQQG
jgi:two-component system nitrogen regulation response regulator GlnG